MASAPQRAVVVEDSTSSSDDDDIVYDETPKLIDLERATASGGASKPYPHEDDRTDVFAQYRLGDKVGAPKVSTEAAPGSVASARVGKGALDDTTHHQSDRSMRQMVRDQRLTMEASERRRPLIWCGLLIVAAGLIMTFFGAIEISSAEHERRDGWTLTTCQIKHNYGANDTQCIYFSVVPNLETFDNRLWCGVPGVLASEAAFHEPPACSHLNRADAEDIQYWRSLGNAQVECYVPTGVGHGPVSSEQCTTAAASRGPSAVVWRSWVDRFVYLVRRPREAAQAIESVTRPRLSTGVALLIIGLGVFALGTCCACNRCVSSVTHAIASHPPRINRYYQRRHAERHKLY